MEPVFAEHVRMTRFDIEEERTEIFDINLTRIEINEANIDYYLFSCHEFQLCLWAGCHGFDHSEKGIWWV